MSLEAVLDTEILHCKIVWQHFTVEMYHGGNSFILHFDNCKVNSRVPLTCYKVVHQY